MIQAYPETGWEQRVARRNNRVGMNVPPLDLTPAQANRTPAPNPFTMAGESFEKVRAARREREREAIARQRKARIQGGIDWTACLVPGCGSTLSIYMMLTSEPEQRDPDKILPLCNEHISVAMRGYAGSVEWHEYQDARLALMRRENAQEAADLSAEREQFKARRDGDIYFVKLNGMVKAGWSRDLYSRIKSYGASAEVLAHYPGTRDDETNLHRQLRPALAKGREWYEDGPIVRLFIGEALARHGAPTIKVRWTEPKSPLVRVKGYRG